MSQIKEKATAIIHDGTPLWNWEKIKLKEFKIT